MNNRKRVISKCIATRRANNEEPELCLLHFTTPRFIDTIEDFRQDEVIKSLINLFEKYSIEYQCVDTIAGSYCLDKVWLEVIDVPCYTEYSGVYPVDWDINDIVFLERLDYEGKIVSQVLICDDEDDKYILNS